MLLLIPEKYKNCIYKLGDEIKVCPNYQNAFVSAKQKGHPAEAFEVLELCSDLDLEARLKYWAEELGLTLEPQQRAIGQYAAAVTRTQVGPGYEVQFDNVLAAAASIKATGSQILRLIKKEEAYKGYKFRYT